MWKCNCPSDYVGSSCENRINPCNQIECLNGGTCIPISDHAISCSCIEGFQGDLCEEESKEDEEDNGEKSCKYKTTFSYWP